jgi:hypothetical protein
MEFLLKRKNQYYFNRRVPKEFREFDKREIIRQSLNTDSLKEAIRLSHIQNQLLEAHWLAMKQKGQKHTHLLYDELQHLAQLLGVPYLPNRQLADLPIEELNKRLQEANKRIDDLKAVNALMGSIPAPTVTLKLSEIIGRFFHYSKGQLWNKSDYQIRKWENPRNLTIRNFIRCVGDKDMIDLTKDDILKYRDYWLGRMAKDTSPKTANKNIIMLKTILDTVNDNMRLGLDTDHLFKKITFKINDEPVRSPFTTEYLRTTLLKPESLAGLNEQARWALYAIAETGAGASEQVALLPEDIRLNCDIPHIVIRPKEKSELKTRYRKRTIPLVGFALDAFKICPSGFTDYLYAPDNLSATLGKYLRENKLFPTENHTVYSLRHSFQDRLLAVNTPDRVQADLMGHKFNRPTYGEGASLQHKLEWIKKIKLKTSNKTPTTI